MSKGLEQLGAVPDGVVGTASDAELPVARRGTLQGYRSEQAIPKLVKSHVPLLGGREMVVAMDGRHRPERREGSDPQVDIRVLQQELDRDEEPEHGSNGRRHPDQQNWGGAGGRFEHLMERMLHQAVETDPPRHAVVDGVQSPERREPMAREVHQRDPRVRHENGQEELEGERPGSWPWRWPWHGGRKKRDACDR